VGFVSAILFLFIDVFVFRGFFFVGVLKLFFFLFVGMLRSLLQVVVFTARKGSTIGDHLDDFRRTRKRSFRGFVFPCSENRA